MSLKKYKVNFKALDALRGIAALYVVINHSRGHLKMGGSQLAEIIPIAQWDLITKIEYSFLKFTSVGTEFVILFFVLSGFSIRHSLSHLNGFNSIIQFYKRRFIRLYLPYIVALSWAYLIFTCLDYFKNPYVNDKLSVFSTLKVSLLNLIYVNKGTFIPQFWSLVHEVFFYILAPFFLFNKRTQVGYLIFSTLLFLIGSFLGSEIVNSNNVSKFLFHYNIYFVIGVLVYEYQHFLSKVKILNHSKLRILMLLIGLPIVVLLKMKFGGDNRYIYLLVCVLSTGLIINTFSESNFYKVFYKLGEWSYTLYVTHIASLYLLVLIAMETGIITQRNTQSSWFWVIGVLFSVVCSCVLYIIGESPTKKVLQKLRTKS